MSECGCVCVCVRERERCKPVEPDLLGTASCVERVREREREREIEGVKEGGRERTDSR